MTFTGFSQKTIDFLIENRQQNSREWFAEHRREYVSFVVTPFRDLVNDLTDVLLTIDSRQSTTFFFTLKASALPTFEISDAINACTSLATI